MFPGFLSRIAADCLSGKHSSMKMLPIWLLASASFYLLPLACPGQNVRGPDLSVLDVDTTWSPDHGPYEINGKLTVGAGATLTIEPGTIIRFKPGASLLVKGVLLANGDQKRRIVFTSSDDKPGGGAWDGIEIWKQYPEKISRISHVTMAHGGALYLNDGNATPMTSPSPNRMESEFEEVMAGLLRSAGAR